MEVYGGLQFEIFIEDDIDILTPIMKRAFDEDTQRHLNQPTGGPDGYDNGDFLRKYALNPVSQAYKISKAGKPIGAIIVWIRENDVNFLGNIFIDPEFQDKGLGLVIWKFIESKYPDTLKWYTDTPGFSRRNHNFYVNKCGFKVIKIKNPRDKYNGTYNGTYILEKQMK